MRMGRHDRADAPRLEAPTATMGIIAQRQAATDEAMDRVRQAQERYSAARRESLELERQVSAHTASADVDALTAAMTRQAALQAVAGPLMAAIEARQYEYERERKELVAAQEARQALRISIRDNEASYGSGAHEEAIKAAQRVLDARIQAKEDHRLAIERMKRDLAALEGSAYEQPKNA